MGGAKFGRSVCRSSFLLLEDWKDPSSVAADLRGMARRRTRVRVSRNREGGEFMV